MHISVLGRDKNDSLALARTPVSSEGCARTEHCSAWQHLHVAGCKCTPGAWLGISLLLALLVLAGCSPTAIKPAAGTTPAAWQAEQIAAMNQVQARYDQAQKKNGVLAQELYLGKGNAAQRGPAYQLILAQYLNWYDGFIGSYVFAQRQFDIAQPLPLDAAPSPLASPRKWHAVSALHAIPELARKYRAVFFNEDHTNPQTRSLTVALLASLRAEGFNTFAAETLNQGKIAALRATGDVMPDTGFYTREPVYADMVRAALRLGYRVIAYEAPKSADGEQREVDQAENLYERAFVGHPDARLVVNAGFGHIAKHGSYLGGRSMAEVFIHRYGIVPLAIEQTMLTDHAHATYDDPYWSTVVTKLHPDQPIVFLDRQRQAWSILPRAYDVSVFFPPERVVNGRPTWLALWGLRFPLNVPVDFCRDRFPCVVEAWARGEPRDAVPEDRVLIRCGGEHRALWLRPGSYQIAAVGEDDQLISQLSLGVSGGSDPAGGGVPLRDWHGAECVASI